MSSPSEVNLTALAINYETLKQSTDGTFLIALGIIIFLMQGGFAFLEAGSVRTKNTVNILIKNMLDCLLGGLAYWAIGWAVAYGPPGNPFIGSSEFFAVGLDPAKYPTWFFQFVFAATTATIVSGAIAERCQLIAYFVYSFFLTGWIYPVVSHWAWAPNGWLATMNYQDYAGSGAVHLLSGLVSLVATALMGARKGRFDERGRPQDIVGHSVPMAAMGGFILLFGFLAFNGGSIGSVTNEGDIDVVSRSVIVTILGGCTGGLTVLFFNRFVLRKKWSYLLTLNGTLSGMVAECSGCNVFEFWAGAVVGIFGGLAYLAVHFLMLRCRLDDPLDATAVHGGGGLVGVTLVTFFAQDTGIFWTSSGWHQLGVNLLGVVAISAWSIIWSLILFVPLKLVGWLRIDEEMEEKGIDILKHGESAYPAQAYQEEQYDSNKNDSGGYIFRMGHSNPAFNKGGGGGMA